MGMDSDGTLIEKGTIMVHIASNWMLLSFTNDTTIHASAIIAKPAAIAN
jgi:hypothetical protein